MPRIPDILLNCSIYLYPSVDDAKNGNHLGGSGFLIGIPFEDKIRDVQHSHVYAVTNKHVIRGGSTVIRINTIYGKVDTIDLPSYQWIDHPYADDLSICPINFSESHQAVFILHDALLTPSRIKQFNIGIGSDVVTIGRFISHEGKERNLPVVRFGNIAMMPLEPIDNPYIGLPQESFLVECRAVSGYSGSIVYASSRPYDDDNKEGGILGVVWGYLYSTEPVRDALGNYLTVDGERVRWQVQSNTGMMAVVPAWKLAELLELEELVMQRKQVEAQKTKEGID